MGGSTNTVLHLLAAAYEGGVDFQMADIDRLSRRVPVLCKVAPSVPDVHIEDVHRAGGIIGILGELDRAGLLNRDVRSVHSAKPRMRAEEMGHQAQRLHRARHILPRRAGRRADPGGLQPVAPLRRPRRRPRQGRDPRSAEHAFSKDGGLAVLFGNLAEEGAIVKTAGVDDANLTFSGPALVFESQDDAVAGHSLRQGRSRATSW